MKKNCNGSYISPWGYVGYSILWAIPVIGWLIWLINCFSGNINKRNYARSIFCTFIFGLIASIVLGVAIFVLTYFGVAPEVTDGLKDLQGMI